MKNEWIVNPNLRLFQSKLLQPSIVANGRWAIYSAISNKVSIAVGKDNFPSIIKLLLKLSRDSSQIKKLDTKTFETLEKSELIIKRNSLRKLDTNFNDHLIDFYRYATYNYPFRDYSDPLWFEKDIFTMNEYAKLNNPPEIYTARNVSEETIISEIDDFNFNIKNKTMSKKILLQILYNIFQHRKIMDNKINPSSKKIIPSGGGKHPVEVFVQINDELDDLKKGLYVYDIKNNCLKKQKKTYKTKHKSSISFILSYRPEKSNWRYRDIRSFRAIFIDAGHILEMLIEMLSWIELNNGISADLVDIQQSYNFKNDWIREPQILEVSIGTEQNHASFEGATYENDQLKVNPFGSIIIKNGNLYFQGNYPEYFKVKLIDNDFLILNESIPSRRRDRDTSYRYLSQKYGQKKIDYLISTGALIDVNLSNNLYNLINSWSQKGWYLNLLAHIDMLNENMRIGDSTLFCSPLPTMSIKNTTNILSRETVRSFTKDSITREQLDLIVKQLKTEKYTVFLNIKNVKNYQSGLYKLLDGKLERIGRDVSDEVIRKCVTNQPFAAQGVVDIFIKAQLTDNGFLKSMINMGVLAQKIINKATELGLGIFVTPAINDEYTNNILNGTVNSAYYYLCVGFKKE